MSLWREGSRTARSIYERLMEEGFKGSYYMVLRYLRRNKLTLNLHRHSLRDDLDTISTFNRMVTNAPSEDLSESEHEQVSQIENGCRDVQNASGIIRNFSEMIRNRDGLNGKHGLNEQLRRQYVCGSWFRFNIKKRRSCNQSRTCSPMEQRSA